MVPLGFRSTTGTVQILECAEKLEPFGVTLRDAVNFYVPHLRAAKRTCSPAELVEELLKVKEADGASERYLSDLRSRLTQFSESLTANQSPRLRHCRLTNGCGALQTGKPGNVSRLLRGTTSGAC